MKTMLMTLFLLMALSSATYATLIYDINYEPPEYVDGQHVGGGTSGETISDSINGFLSQALLIHDGGAISYYAPEVFDYGIHHVTWDFSVPVDQSSSQIISAQLMGDGSPILFDTTLDTGLTGYEIDYGSGFPIRPSINFNIGQSYSFAVEMNLDADYYSFWVDGNLLEDAVSIASDADLYVVGFGQNQTMGLQAGIDNFRWEVVPEPSTWMLFLCGGGALLVRRCKKQCNRKSTFEKRVSASVGDLG